MVEMEKVYLMKVVIFGAWRVPVEIFGSRRAEVETFEAWRVEVEILLFQEQALKMMASEMKSFSPSRH